MHISKPRSHHVVYLAFLPIAPNRRLKKGSIVNRVSVHSFAVILGPFLARIGDYDCASVHRPLLSFLRLPQFSPCIRAMIDGAHLSLVPAANATAIIVRYSCAGSLSIGKMNPVLTQAATRKPDRDPARALDIASMICNFFGASLLGKLFPILKIIERTAPSPPARNATVRKKAGSPRKLTSDKRLAHRTKPTNPIRSPAVNAIESCQKRATSTLRWVI